MILLPGMLKRRRTSQTAPLLMREQVRRPQQSAHEPRLCEYVGDAENPSIEDASDIVGVNVVINLVVDVRNDIDTDDIPLHYHPLWWSCNTPPPE
eukprot:gene345-biopygen939